MTERRGAFSNADKQIVREAANGKSSISDADNNGIVHHLRGCHVGELAGVPEQTISDIKTNALMLSDEEAADLDSQEDYERACLEYEVLGRTIYEHDLYINPDYHPTHYEIRGRKNTRHQRRRRKHR